MPDKHDTKLQVFLQKTNELFLLGYNLPTKILQVQAVDRVHKQVLDWKDILSKTGDNYTDISCVNNFDPSNKNSPDKATVVDFNEKETTNVPCQKIINNEKTIIIEPNNECAVDTVMLPDSDTNTMSGLDQNICDNVSNTESKSTIEMNSHHDPASVETPMVYSMEDNNSTEHKSEADFYITDDVTVETISKGETSDISQDVYIKTDTSDNSKRKRSNLQRKASQRIKAILKHIEEVEEIESDEKRPTRNQSNKISSTESELNDDFPNIVQDVAGDEKEIQTWANQSTQIIIKMESENSFLQNELIMPEDASIMAERVQQTPAKKSRGRPRKTQTVADALFENLNLMHKCSKCSKSFGCTEVLESHMQVHMDCVPIVCSVCNKAYHSRGGFDNHIRGHDPENQIQCPYCDFRCPNYTVMNRHVSLKHDSKDSRPYLCDLCGKGFLQPSTLKGHMATHLGEKKFSCDQCSFCTHTRNILNIHKKNMHVQKEYYACDLCDVKLKYKGSLVEHRRRHFGEKPHLCSLCDSRFTSRSQLAQHVRIHKAKEFACDVCGKQFINKHKLARHRIIHTGQKDFACGFCSYRCNVRGNIRKHWMFVHKMDHDRRMKHVQVLGADGTQEVQGYIENTEGVAGHISPLRPIARRKPLAQQQKLNNVNTSKNNNGASSHDSKTADEDSPSETHELMIEFPQFEAKYPITTHLQTNVSNSEVSQAQANLPPILPESSFIQSSAAVNVQISPSAITVPTVKNPSISKLEIVTIPAENEDLTQQSVAQENVYARDMDVETKVEVTEDGTEYVYLYFSDDQPESQVTATAANTEEYIITMEETTETQQAALSVNNIL